jgi:S1-C subfamily serine protease
MLPLLLLAVFPAEIEVLPSTDFPKPLQATAVAATVRLRNATTGGEGSGVLVGRSGPFVYILTANHVTDRSERVEVAVFTAGSYPRPDKVYQSGEVVARSVEGDLALIRLATRDPMPAMLRIPLPGRGPDGKDFPALSIGCSAGGAPTPRLETVKGKRQIRKPGEEQAAAYWEMDAAPARGRSGGPLLDRSGGLIGVCSGVGDGKGYYSHTEQMHRFLRRSGYAWLYDEVEGR